MSEIRHHWYSAKMEKHRAKTGKFHNRDVMIHYALINEKVVIFSESTAKKEHCLAWDDVMYLGEGTFHHSEKLS